MSKSLPTLGEGPKFQLDPRVEWIAPLERQTDPKLPFQVYEIGSLALIAASKNLKSLFPYLDIVKIRFSWAEMIGNAPEVRAECYFKEEYGISTAATAFVVLPKEHEEQVEAVKRLGTRFYGGGVELAMSRYKIFTSRAEELMKIASILENR